MAQRFSHTDQSVDRADFGQHMGRIGALFAACFEPAPFLEEREHRRQKLFLGLSGDQACAKLTQNGGIKAGIGEVQAERLLPINPTPNRLSSLSV